ncbi:zinc finger protein AZF3-like [Zingiber officinale]|uniref:zinc finger protein AZF3-like n=1 Tax=Zingiber officinale TaxID=94328 RepID=UPI001C4D7FAD|nr:zinc finger protein AZF3-like [Zingiber officinale]
MATGFLQRTLPALWTPKRQRTERPRPSPPPPSSLLDEDEQDCLLGLLLLSRALDSGGVFSSYRALGVHNSSHRKRPAVISGAVAKKKPHECSVCHVSFPTGQALGGHMRSHFNGGRRQARSRKSLAIS